MTSEDTTGEILWKFHTGAPVRGQPITYKIDGTQYVAIPHGDNGEPDTERPPGTGAHQGNTLVVFSLPKQQV
jgi:alcohol dehydrogenase (cytochrome c)